jgi:hypothetical protein
MQYEAAKDKIEELFVVFKSMNLKTRLFFNDPDYSIKIFTLPIDGGEISLSETIRCSDSRIYLKLKNEFEG